MTSLRWVAIPPCRRTQRHPYFTLVLADFFWDWDADFFLAFFCFFVGLSVLACVCVGACWLGNHSEQTKERFTTLCDTTCVVGSGLLASVHRTTPPNLENPYEGQDVFQSGHGRQQELHRMPRLFTVEEMVREIVQDHMGDQSQSRAS